MGNDTKEVLTREEKITLRRSGTSDKLLVPAHWRKTLRCLQGSPLIFDAHVERDGNGRIFIVFKKVSS